MIGLIPFFLPALKRSARPVVYGGFHKRHVHLTSPLFILRLSRRMKSGEAVGGTASQPGMNAGPSAHPRPHPSNDQ